MIRRCVGLMFVASGIAISSSALVNAQAPSPTSKATAAATPAAVPKTHGGQPDLQGIWINSSVIPLERPANLKDKEFYSKEEAAENAKQVLGISSWERLGSQAAVHYNMSQFGLDLSQVKVAMSLRTS